MDWKSRRTDGPAQPEHRRWPVLESVEVDLTRSPFTT